MSSKKCRKLGGVGHGFRLTHTLSVSLPALATTPALKRQGSANNIALPA